MKTAMKFLLPLMLLMPSNALAGEKPYPFIAGADKASIILRWAPSDAEFPPGGFNVYRRGQKGTTWEKLNSTPLKKITDQKILRKKLGDELSGRGLDYRDGFGDALFGSPRSSPDGRTSAGAVYVWFGSRTLLPTWLSFRTDAWSRPTPGHT